MSNPIRVFGICGSWRRQSFNRSLLQAAVELAPLEMTIDVFDRLGEIPLFNQDDEQNPHDAVVDLKKRIRTADAILFVTPEYNFSIPGVLKNAIDAASRPYGDNAWSGKPAAIMGASIGALGTARAQYHLRQVCVNLNVFPMNGPEVMIASASTKFDAEGKLTDQPTRDYIQKLLQGLIEWTNRLKGK